MFGVWGFLLHHKSEIYFTLFFPSFEENKVLYHFQEHDLESLNQTLKPAFKLPGDFTTHHGAIPALSWMQFSFPVSRGLCISHFSSPTAPLETRFEGEAGKGCRKHVPL